MIGQRTSFLRHLSFMQIDQVPLCLVLYFLIYSINRWANSTLNSMRNLLQITHPACDSILKISSVVIDVILTA